MTYGYGALEIWRVQIEMCYILKIIQWVPKDHKEKKSKIDCFYIDCMVKYYFGLNNTKLKLMSRGFPFSNVALRKYKITHLAFPRGLPSISTGQNWSRS